MTLGAGVLMQGRGHISLIVKMHYIFKNLLLYSQTTDRQSKYKLVVMVTKELSTKIVNFMTPGVGFLVLRCGHVSYIVKIHHFFKNLLYSQAQIRQTEGIVMMSKEGSTKIVKLITPRAGVLVLGPDHISHIVKMHYLFKNLLLFTQT